MANTKTGDPAVDTFLKGYPAAGAGQPRPANGVDLPDPDGLLEGEGKGIRHVKLTSPEAAGAPAVRELIRGALHATRNGA